MLPMQSQFNQLQMEYNQSQQYQQYLRQRQHRNNQLQMNQQYIQLQQQIDKITNITPMNSNPNTTEMNNFRNGNSNKLLANTNVPTPTNPMIN